MKNTTIYATGLPGFKSAIKSSLGQKWMDDAKDLDENLIRFELPHTVTPEGFKRLIGNETLYGHNVMFFYDLHHNSLPTVDAVVASIWNLIEFVIKVKLGRRWRHSMYLLRSKFRFATKVFFIK
jgi:hypothetical protein